MDSDDEVRDRATFYMNVLQQKQKALNAAYIFNGTHTHTHTHTRGTLSNCVCLLGKIDKPCLHSAGVVINVHVNISSCVCRSQVCRFLSPDWRSPSTSTRWSPQRNLST